MSIVDQLLAYKLATMRKRLPPFVSGLPRPKVCRKELVTFLDVLQSMYNQDTFAFSP